MSEYFTLIFEGDLGSFEHPFSTVTPFGIPVSACLGDAFERNERDADEIDRLRTALTAETDRCAKIAKGGWLDCPYGEIADADAMMELSEHIAAAIRARAPSPAQPDAAKVERVRILTEALTLAANRLDRLMLECPNGSAIRLNAYEWVTEARAALTAAQEQT